jgi:hypothetical protein
VTPGPGREEFDAHEFVRGTGTLYSLSKEGKGSAGALVAGLTVAVTEAAEELAKRSPGGRLIVPLVAPCSTRPPMCAAGRNCRTSTATTGRAASAR